MSNCCSSSHGPSRSRTGTTSSSIGRRTRPSSLSPASPSDPVSRSRETPVTIPSTRPGGCSTRPRWISVSKGSGRIGLFAYACCCSTSSSYRFANWCLQPACASAIWQTRGPPTTLELDCSSRQAAAGRCAATRKIRSGRQGSRSFRGNNDALIFNQEIRFPIWMVQRCRVLRCGQHLPEPQPDSKPGCADPGPAAVCVSRRRWNCSAWIWDIRRAEAPIESRACTSRLGRPSEAGPGVLVAELDALRQRQIGEVDRIRLPAHVGLPRVRTRFAAAAGFLLAAERAADLGAAGADVDVGDAAIGTGRRQELLGRSQVLR